jgi:hypothetical protein
LDTDLNPDADVQDGSQLLAFLHVVHKAHSHLVGHEQARSRFARVKTHGHARQYLSELMPWLLRTRATRRVTPRGNAGAMAYDASRDALMSPAQEATYFAQLSGWHEDALRAELARLAYIAFETGDDQREVLNQALAAGGLTLVDTHDDPSTGTQAYAATDASGRLHVAFRGTETNTSADILTDLDIFKVAYPGGGMVHRGFYRAYCGDQDDTGARQLLRRWISNNPGCEVLLTGHSLGAALATLACADLITEGLKAAHQVNLVSFGSPRVGDSAFCALLSGAVVSRYVNCCDIVTQLPPQALGFAHAGALHYLSAEGKVELDWSDEQIDADRDRARRQYLLSDSVRTGTNATRELSDHAPKNYISAMMACR